MSDDPGHEAYLVALTLLSRRELSTAQLRQRLQRRQFAPEAIDRAIVRLTADRTLDDGRVALAAARLEASIKGRGKRRVVHALQHLGISPAQARSAADAVFHDVDEQALLDRALEKCLKGASPTALDDKARARVIRRLVAQGFEPSRVFARLRRPRNEGDE